KEILQFLLAKEFQFLTTQFEKKKKEQFEAIEKIFEKTKLEHILTDEDTIEGMKWFNTLSGNLSSWSNIKQASIGFSLSNIDFASALPSIKKIVDREANYLAIEKAKELKLPVINDWAQDYSHVNLVE